MTVHLHTAANGHLMLEFDTRGSPAWDQAVRELQQRRGYTRSGHTVEGAGEGIAPSFVQGPVVIAAGWDEWAGDYLLAACDAGDEVLRALARSLGESGR